MKAILYLLRYGATLDLVNYELIGYGDGSMAVRIKGNGLMSQCEPCNQKGWNRLMKWIDTDPE